MKKHLYLGHPKEVSEVLSRHECAVPSWGAVDLGVVRAYCGFGRPLAYKQYSPNFTLKYYLGKLLLWSASRTDTTRCLPKAETEKRAPRIYLSLGSLPYVDNRSGIPRVAKELNRNGLMCREANCVPIYPDPRSGTYRIAKEWVKDQNLDAFLDLDMSTEGDPEVTVQSGDWLIHTMINSNEIAFMKPWFDAFRQAGGCMGFVCHDLIPEDYPQFCRKRDIRLFQRWLQQISEADALFTVSQATKDSYLAWAKRNNVPSVPPVGVFHLGANFKSMEGAVTALPQALQERPFFLQVSTIEPRKGYAQLVHAFELLWKEGIDVNLALVGREGWKVGKLCRYIRNHPEFGKRLFWFNWATDEELGALYQHSYAVVVTSEIEGFGLTVSEGLHYGKDLLVRDIPVFREVAGDNASYFSGLRPEDLAEGLKKMLAPERERKVRPATHAPALSWAESFQQFLSQIRNFDHARH